ncbi:hypothetical protein [Streptomyces mirabilis]
MPRCQSYLHQRWREGHTSGAKLHAELRERGFTGSYSVVRDYLRRFRRTPADRPSAARPPGVRKVTGWITRNPDRMNDDDQQNLKAILARCPELEAATGHVRSFAAMMAIRSASRLPEWIAAARADVDHGLRGFADGLLADLDAVILGLSTEWSSGCVEGRVTDIKLLKRQGQAVPACPCSASASCLSPPTADNTESRTRRLTDRLHGNLD